MFLLINVSSIEIILTLFTELITFYVGVFIIKVEVLSLEKLSGDICLFQKKRESRGRISVMFQVDFYKLVE